MLTAEQIKNLKPGDKVAVTYIPAKRKRPVTNVYLFDRFDRDDSVVLMTKPDSMGRFVYRLWDERLSLVEE